MPGAAKKARELNDSIRYTMWSVFRLRDVLGESPREEEAAELEELVGKLEADDVVVRGLYDLSGLRADADLLVWSHAEEVEQLQAGYQQLRRTRFGRRLEPVWSQVALHRPAEFNKSHVPAFLAGEEARDFVCVYPFVRSYEWYLLEDSERRRMLAEHGQMAREYKDVRANTVASFALGDYEWILAFEADELHRIVDLMRHLRASDARRHVREEVPFYTGRRRTPDRAAHRPALSGDESVRRGRSVQTSVRGAAMATFRTTLMQNGNNVGIEVPEDVVARLRCRQAGAGEGHRERAHLALHGRGDGRQVPRRHPQGPPRGCRSRRRRDPRGHPRARRGSEDRRGARGPRDGPGGSRPARAVRRAGLLTPQGARQGRSRTPRPTRPGSGGSPRRSRS